MRTARSGAVGRYPRYEQALAQRQAHRHAICTFSATAVVIEHLGFEMLLPLAANLPAAGQEDIGRTWTVPGLISDREPSAQGCHLLPSNLLQYHSMQHAATA
jgi:hypothetical protein